jgi:hypothetical protein
VIATAGQVGGPHLILEPKDTPVRISIRSLLASALLAVVLSVIAGSAASAAGTQVPRIAGGKVILDFRPHHTQLQSQALTGTGRSV